MEGAIRLFVMGCIRRATRSFQCPCGYDADVAEVRAVIILVRGVAGMNRCGIPRCLVPASG